MPNKGINHKVWTQLDPSGQNAGYLYASDDPVNFVDPSGYLNTDSNALASSAIYGCAVGATGVLGAAVATTAATGGAAAPVSGLELGTGCILGGAAQYYNTLIGPGGDAAFSINDVVQIFKGFLF